MIEVVFIDSAPWGAERRSLKALDNFRNLQWRTHRFATRATSAGRLVVDRVCQKYLRMMFNVTGLASSGALSTRAFGLERVLNEVAADVYLGHNAETLLPVFRTAQRRGALALFDSMEFHSDMGDGQSQIEKRLTREIEKRVLPQCALVLASSTHVAAALAQEYGIPCPLALDNVPPVEKELPPNPKNGLALYWRNAVVGLGQRGLDEALVALTRLPADVVLHLQGRLPIDGGAAMKARISKLGLTERVFFHAPYAPENAVKEAARHHVGLCLERHGCRNHELTVSNKIFDYHMAGLAVIASDLPGLRGVIQRSHGGLLFVPGSADDLAVKILSLYQDRALFRRLAQNAREFALREGNRDWEMKKFTVAFASVCRAQFGLEL